MVGQRPAARTLLTYVIVRVMATSGEARRQLYPHVLGLVAPLLIEPWIGVPYLSVAAWLRDFFSWSEDERAAWQNDRLRTVLAHATRDVPFYRKYLGRDAPEDIGLSDLPVVDKARIRADTGSFLSERSRGIPSVSKTTGGSTGDPWRYPLDRRAWAQIYGASLHFWERTGYRYGERIVLLGSPPSLVPHGTSWKSRARNRVERRVVSVAGVAIDHATSLRRAMRAGASSAGLWYGFAGTLTAMADAVAAEGPTLIPPRAIVSTSEMLEPRTRERIESVFGRPVFDQYGCNDGGVLAQTCRRGLFHVADNVSLVEILDGDRRCAPGEEGDVTVTNLHANLLPFLRYKVGDRAVMHEGTCSCGQPGTVLEKLAGREWDQLELPDGTKLSAMAVLGIFRETAHVRRWQVVQLDRHRVKLRLDVEPGFDEDEAQTIRRLFHRRDGGALKLDIVTDEPIERTPGGKYKAMIRLPTGQDGSVR